MKVDIEGGVLLYYETKFFQEIVELMASCDRLGLMYVVQKEYVEKGKWFHKSTEEIYKLQVVQYVEEEYEYEKERKQTGEDNESTIENANVLHRDYS
jgi:predicted glycosyltransferase